MSVPAVSVIIPVFNGENWLRQCLDSALSQSLRSIEVIVVDDGSVPSVAAVIDEYASGDSRMRVIRNNSCAGAGASRNRGMEAAEGEYLAFLDSDDFYPTADALKTLYDKAKTRDAEICGGSLYTVDAKGNVINDRLVGQVFSQEGWKDFSKYQFVGGFNRFLYRRSTLKEKFSLWLRFQDPPFMARAMHNAGRFYAVADYVYAYRKGHKDVIWTERRIMDCLYGIQEVFFFAKECGYSSLKWRMRTTLFYFMRLHIRDSFADRTIFRDAFGVVRTLGVMATFLSPIAKWMDRIRGRGCYGK